MSYPINKTVTEVGQINFTGNITPHTWYIHLRYPNGKPHTNAISILAEIVYWHRPRIIRDEATGGVLRIEKRFKADKLQRSYQSFVKQFGFTKKQVRDAVNFLVDAGVIRKELRDITTTDVPLYNVLYLEVVPAKLREINQVTPPYLEVTPPYLEVDTPQPVGQTNTETPTESTTENHNTPPENDNDFSKISTSWQNNFGLLNPIIADNLKAALKEHPADWIIEAMKRAVEQNVRKWSYVNGILRNFEAAGGPQHNGTGKKKQEEYGKTGLGAK